MTAGKGHEPGEGGVQAESLVAVSRLEQVLEERLDARGRAERHLRTARQDADRLREEAKSRGRTAAAARREKLIEAAEHDAVELERSTAGEVAALRDRALRRRTATVDAIVERLLPGGR